jgi:regulator of protease activity HflC (stomatin/prohibitin superfamily)
LPADLNDYFGKKKSSNNNNQEPPRKSSGGNGGGMQPPEPPQFLKDLGNKGALFYVIVAIVAVIFFMKPYTIINEGERGIKVTTGKYEPTPLQPGLHFLIPGIQKIILVDTKIRIINYKSTIDRVQRDSGIQSMPAIMVLDKRGLPVKIELTVQYRLNQQFASQTISTWGTSWEEKIINPVARDIVRNVVGNYEAETLPVQRNAIAKKIEDGIRAKVEALENKPTILESVQLREIILPAKVKEQIERVQVAKQEVERAQQEVERTKQEALKRAEKERGEAEAIMIAAQGDAEAVRIRAEAQAKANKLISDSLTPRLLQLKQVEIQGKFNEALATNKDAKVFLTPGGAVPNIWVDLKNPQKQQMTSKAQ